MDLYIKKNIQIQHIFQNYASVEDILPYSIDEGFIDLTSSLNYFIPDRTVTRKDKLDMISGRIKEIFGGRQAFTRQLGCLTAIPYWPS